MEPHYGGWMHGRAHGFLNIEGVAINHDINHLTVLDWEQTRPFMNDTFNYPQWPALEVSDDTVINYFQSMVTLGNPLEGNLNQLQTTLTSDTDEDQWNEFNRIEPKTTKTGRSRFIGTAQPDALISTAQKDIMTGRGGADLFAFIRTGGPIDVVTDFNRLDEDKIGIDAESFPGIDTMTWPPPTTKRNTNNSSSQTQTSFIKPTQANLSTTKTAQGKDSAAMTLRLPNSRVIP